MTVDTTTQMTFDMQAEIRVNATITGATRGPRPGEIEVTVPVHGLSGEEIGTVVVTVLEAIGRIAATDFVIVPGATPAAEVPE